MAHRSESMKYIRDEYELPGDDEIEEGYVGALLRRPRRPYIRFAVMLAALVVMVGMAGSIAAVSINERDDNFCIGCHTIPEQTYLDRGNTAVGGALALDLASYHYQQIRGQGGDIHCITCHAGDGSLGHFVDTRIMSARYLVEWLAGRFDSKVEKLGARVPHLSNDGCVVCHDKTLLLAGTRNHYHNMLPVAYRVWKNGGRLIPPADVKDVQGIIAAGLALYDTTVQCHTCHQAHRALETPLYLDPQAVRVGCIQCHLEVGQGPPDVTYTPEE